MRWVAQVRWGARCGVGGGVVGSVTRKHRSRMQAPKRAKIQHGKDNGAKDYQHDNKKGKKSDPPPNNKEGRGKKNFKPFACIGCGEKHKLDQCEIEWQIHDDYTIKSVNGDHQPVESPIPPALRHRYNPWQAETDTCQR